MPRVSVVDRGSYRKHLNECLLFACAPHKSDLQIVHALVFIHEVGFIKSFVSISLD